MELRRYLQAIRQRWKLVAFVMVVTVAATVFLVSRESDVYQSSGTYVVRPSLESDDVVQATDALNRGAEINSTYARVARSDVVRARAKAVLEQEGVDTDGLRVVSEVLPGTNIIRIGASGPDPDRVTAYAAAIGAETASYLQETGELFVLQQLDTPEVPGSAERSNSVFTVAIGLVFGLLAGSVLAFAAEYADETPKQSTMNIRDALTGAYTDDYFRLRLRQEMSRCQTPADLRSRPPTQRKGKGKKARKRDPGAPIFTVGMIVMHTGDPSQNGAGPIPEPLELRDAAQTLQSRLRFQDVLAYLGENRFALVCPDLTRTGVDQIIARWNKNLQVVASERGALLYATSATCQCDSQGLYGDETAMKEAYGV